ncbi:FAD-dependent oxidoreductase [Chloroflexota bacterium]
MAKLTKLFEPGMIGKMEVKNRIVLSPMGTMWVDDEWFITQQAIDYYVERAKGGVGLIVSGANNILWEAPFRGLPMLSDDKFIPKFKELAHAVHEHGAKMSLQIHHGGKTMLTEKLRRPEGGEGIDAIGPSAVPWIKVGVAPKEAAKEDIKRIARGFAEAARRVKEAGFDAVSIHGGHGYLISNFLSPFTNKRTDEYGGTPEKRARFACEIIAAIREKVGPDFPILFRFSGSDYLPGGTTIEDSCRQAPLFAEAGADALHISAGAHESTEWQFLTYLFPPAPTADLYEAVKKVVKVPVIGVGKIGDPLIAESILEEGKADFVAMGRALIADPALPNKAKEGRLDDIRRCIYCNNCLSEMALFLYRDAETSMATYAGLACTVNPAVGKESEYQIKPASSPKKVMVIGGGLAGMEAARVLAERGHQVTLYEKADKLGGQWNTAIQSPSKEELFPTVSERLTRGLDESAAKVVLNKEVTRQFVEEEKPDAVVVATGAVPVVPTVPGIDNKNVVQAIDVFDQKVPVGQKVVVVGGRLRGLEVADLLAGQGKKVSVVTLKGMGENGDPVEQHIFRFLRRRLIDQGVAMFPYSPLFEVREDGIIVDNSHHLLFLEADTVVLAMGARPENRLVEELKGVVPEVYTVGDCVKPRNAMYAIREGAEIGHKI